MSQANPAVYAAQSLGVPSTAHTRHKQQQARERLELRALALGADHTLAQLAAEHWLQQGVMA